MTVLKPVRILNDIPNLDTGVWFMAYLGFLDPVFEQFFKNRTTVDTIFGRHSISNLSTIGYTFAIPLQNGPRFGSFLLSINNPKMKQSNSNLFFSIHGLGHCGESMPGLLQDHLILGREQHDESPDQLRRVLGIVAPGTKLEVIKTLYKVKRVDVIWIQARPVQWNTVHVW